MTNRAESQKFIIENIGKLTEGSENAAIYTKILEGMSDKEYGQFMADLESGAKFLTIISPNFTKAPLKVERNLSLAKELGHNFFQKLWIEGTDDTPTYLTPNEYMVVDLPVRRVAQLLIKKISVPKHNKIIDALTGQPTGESKGARMSYPELQIASAMGLDNCMVELMKYRGGDSRGGAALAGMISKYGTANLSTLNNYASGVESTYTLKAFLTSAHLKNTL